MNTHALKFKPVVALLIEERSRDGVDTTVELFATEAEALASLRKTLEAYGHEDMPSDDDELLDWYNDELDGHASIQYDVPVPENVEQAWDTGEHRCFGPCADPIHRTVVAYEIPAETSTGDAVIVCGDCLRKRLHTSGYFDVTTLELTQTELNDGAKAQGPYHCNACGKVLSTHEVTK